MRDLFSYFKTRIWMQKLDCKGNPIHSTISSKDPSMPALDTPQYHHHQMLLQKQGKPNYMDGCSTVGASDLAMPRGGNDLRTSTGRVSADSVGSVNGRRSNCEKHMQDIQDRRTIALSGSPSEGLPHPMQASDYNMAARSPGHYTSENSTFVPAKTSPALPHGYNPGADPNGRYGNAQQQRSAPSGLSNPPDLHGPRHSHAGNDHPYVEDRHESVSALSSRIAHLHIGHAHTPRAYTHDSFSYPGHHQHYSGHDDWSGPDYPHRSKAMAHGRPPASSFRPPPSAPRQGSGQHNLPKNTCRQVHVPSTYDTPILSSGSSDYRRGVYSQIGRAYAYNVSAPEWEPSGSGRCHGSSQIESESFRSASENHVDSPYSHHLRSDC